MLLKFHKEHLSEQKLHTVIKHLKEGAIIVFPTDTVYAFGCDLFQPGAIERLISISGKKKPDFSFICSDISQASGYMHNPEKPLFKEMKRLFPGPYTFVVQASPQVSRLMQTNKKTVGIRVLQNEIALAIVKELGNPLISTSLHSEDSILDYMTDPHEIEAQFRGVIDLVVDGGTGGNLPSTVIDYTRDKPVVVREGAGMEKLNA